MIDHASMQHQDILWRNILDSFDQKDEEIHLFLQEKSRIVEDSFQDALEECQSLLHAESQNQRQQQQKERQPHPHNADMARENQHPASTENMSITEINSNGVHVPPTKQQKVLSNVADSNDINNNKKEPLMSPRAVKSFPAIDRVTALMKERRMRSGTAPGSAATNDQALTKAATVASTTTTITTLEQQVGESAALITFIPDATNRPSSKNLNSTSNISTGSTSSSTLFSEHIQNKIRQNQRQKLETTSAIKIQAWVRRFLARIRFVLMRDKYRQLQLQRQREEQRRQEKAKADHAYAKHLLRRSWYVWLNVFERKRRWREKIASVRRLYGPFAIHRHLGRKFDARSVFSKYGKMEMAKQYYLWRLRATFYVRWCFFMAGFVRRHEDCPKNQFVDHDTTIIGDSGSDNTISLLDSSNEEPRT